MKNVKAFRVAKYFIQDSAARRAKGTPCLMLFLIPMNPRPPPLVLVEFLPFEYPVLTAICIVGGTAKGDWLRLVGWLVAWLR